MNSKLYSHVYISTDTAVEKLSKLAKLAKDITRTSESWKLANILDNMVKYMLSETLLSMDLNESELKSEEVQQNLMEVITIAVYNRGRLVDTIAVINAIIRMMQHSNVRPQILIKSVWKLYNDLYTQPISHEIKDHLRESIYALEAIKDKEQLSFKLRSTLIQDIEEVKSDEELKTLLMSYITVL